MIEYRFRNDGNGKPKECDCCGYPAPLGRFEASCDMQHEEPDWLCEVCSRSHLSKAVQYPEQVDHPELYYSLGWIANRLLEALGQLNESAPQPSNAETPGSEQK
jgi:hypothetical protein